MSPTFFLRGTAASVYALSQQNLRALGVVLIAVLVSLLAVVSNSYDSTFGILGAIAGYLFGKDRAAENEVNG